MTDRKRDKILIVDDIKSNMLMLDVVLKNNYEILYEKTGEEALRRVKTSRPDLILLDIMLPGMDGYEVCGRLKNNEQTRDIPVIFISALGELENVIKGFSAGGVDYIIKPFQEKEVLARVETHLTLRRLQRRLEEQNNELQEALDTVKTLKGLLPICSSCKKIRDDKGYWNQIESYISKHSDAFFSHGICPDCMRRLYGDQEWYSKYQESIT
ncbi:MAG: response regulator [Desulfobacterales bacterium]|nr:response regulator [Desulfobacterales bacterium]